MSPELRNSSAVVTESPEPQARSGAVPVWIFVLLFLLLYWGFMYFDSYSGWFSPQVYIPYKNFADVREFQPPTGGASLDEGKAQYDNVCALCHNPDGAGKPAQAPALTGSEWVTGNPNRLIRIPLYGLTGPIEVKGQNWNLSMPAMGANFSDEQVAAVLSYMRQSWGNKASPITPEQVKAVRAQVGARSQPFTAAELNSVP